MRPAPPSGGTRRRPAPRRPRNRRGRGAAAGSTRDRRISDAEYRQRYEAERRRALAEQERGSRSGDRALNRPRFWATERDDAEQMDAWEDHAWRLARRGMWTGTYYALQPDGSWRPWLPTALRPQPPPEPGEAAEDWDAVEARRFPPGPAAPVAALALGTPPRADAAAAPEGATIPTRWGPLATARTRP